MLWSGVCLWTSEFWDRGKV
uniref:Uncharacterized protein n=1 Tax=Anguilla anguilla TaxID=7936 RepID=A0A0E9TN58_ANGAN